MINQIENDGWNLPKDVVDTKISVPEAAVRGTVSVE
jgi:hypothetical protein